MRSNGASSPGSGGSDPGTSINVRAAAQLEDRDVRVALDLAQPISRQNSADRSRSRDPEHGVADPHRRALIHAVKCCTPSAGLRIGSVSRMTYRVVVWGTGNVGSAGDAGDRRAPRPRARRRGRVEPGEGRAATRASSPGIEPLGVLATDDVDGGARGRRRRRRLHRDRGHPTRRGATRICSGACAPASTSSRPPSIRCCTRRARRPSCSTSVGAACAEGDSSVFVSGIDPGWALDILPALVSGVGAGITEIRIQELFNYALYDQPDVVREVIGFGGPMDELPLMLLDFSLQMVWAPMLRILGRPARGGDRRDHDPRRAPAAGVHDRGAGHGHVRGAGRRARSASR